MAVIYKPEIQTLLISNLWTLTADDMGEAIRVAEKQRIEVLKITSCRSVNLAELTNHGIPEIKIHGGKVKGIKDFERATIRDARTVEDIQVSRRISIHNTKRVTNLTALYVWIEDIRRVSAIKAPGWTDIEARYVYDVSTGGGTIRATKTKNIHWTAGKNSTIRLMAPTRSRILRSRKNKISHITNFDTVTASNCLIGTNVTTNTLNKRFSTRRSFRGMLSSPEALRPKYMSSTVSRPERTTNKQKPKASFAVPSDSKEQQVPFWRNVFSGKPAPSPPEKSDNPTDVQRPFQSAPTPPTQKRSQSK